MTVTPVVDTSKGRGFQSYTGSTYSTVRAGNLAMSAIDSYPRLGQITSGGDYVVYRVVSFWDTSVIPVGAVISAARIILNMYSFSRAGNDFKIQVQNGQPTYPSDPVVLTDYDQADYSGNGGQSTLPISAMSAGQNDIPLNATGISWINCGGTTKFMLRSTNDIVGTAPPDGEWAGVYGPAGGVGYEPILEVTWTPGAGGPGRSATMKTPLYRRPIQARVLG